jgi:hypothetical protein
MQTGIGMGAFVCVLVGGMAAVAGGAEKLPADGATVKRILKAPAGGRNLLKADQWRPWGEGFEREGSLFVCDNGADGKVQRGASQTVVLDQTKPGPIVAAAWSKAEGVGGSPDADYSLYLDLLYADGTPLWGQVWPFRTGGHDWQRAEVLVFPAKPVKSVSVHLLLRRHAGKASFRDPQLYVMQPPKGACLFDGVPVAIAAAGGAGFQVRDVAADGDFVRIEREALGLRLDCKTSQRDGATFFDATLSDTTGKDRAVTLLYAVPLAGEGLRWCEHPRRSVAVEAGAEYMNAARFRVGANGRLSRYPLGAVAGRRSGEALAIDMAHPAFYRIGCNGGSRELFLAYDIALAPEKPSARVRFCRFPFEPRHELRSALAKLYALYPDYFRCRTAKQGLWMPFAKISQVQGWEDFGFAFKEGNNETTWDDAHGIITFRYTEPMTWWMRMPKDMPRTLEAAVAEAKRLADKGDARARALFTSSFHNEAGQFPARFLDTPWCNGVVWSVNSMPGVAGEQTDFKCKWGPAVREELYGPKRKGDLDGEYVDSSECYVTDELDFRREHFAAAQRPLTFSLGTRRPGVFKLLAVFEYVRAIGRDVHGMGKLMMANSTPSRVCWLAPMLEVMGTETDWHRGGRWQPMSDAELLYRRAVCGPKPYCFLMNTRFEDFSHALVEKYMKRSLAYGMFPGFFSHNASQGQYFTRPKLYDRDRPLFRKYVPLCKLVAEAGWQPVTGAYTSDAKVHVERFGKRYLTVFNDSSERRTVTLTMDFAGPIPKPARELVSGAALAWHPSDSSVRPQVEARLALDGEDVAVIDLQPGGE